MLKLDSNIIARIQQSEILVIGCSAGGFHLVFELILQLPENFLMPVVVVIHRGKKYKTSIERLLDHKANVSVKIADDKEILKKGCVYFAPSDYHLLLEPEGAFTLDYSEPVMYCRPSIDITFQSVADVWGNKVIAILLSGANADGAEGLATIKRNGGMIVVQNPDSAEVRTMPEAAINKSQPDFILNNDTLIEFVTQIGIIKSGLALPGK